MTKSEIRQTKKKSPVAKLFFPEMLRSTSYQNNLQNLMHLFPLIKQA